MDLMNEIKEIFRNSVCCGNCGYHGEDCYCSRVEELFGVEVRTADDSTCICLDGFKFLQDEEEEETKTEIVYCKDCPDFDNGICREAYYMNQPYEVSENDYCEVTTGR